MEPKGGAANQPREGSQEGPLEAATPALSVQVRVSQQAEVGKRSCVWSQMHSHRSMKKAKQGCKRPMKAGAGGSGVWRLPDKGLERTARWLGC